MPKSKEIISSSESESGSASSEEEVKQKSKAKKPEKKRKESSASDNSESEEDTKSKKRPKKQDKGSTKKVKKNSKADEEETCWDIGGKKQVNVREFKNKWFVDIREMYLDKEGEMKPGKKGVCLNMENWRSFMKIVEDVDKAVKAKCS